jgi:hypothetical protein
MIYRRLNGLDDVMKANFPEYASAANIKTAVYVAGGLAVIAVVIIALKKRRKK